MATTEYTIKNVGNQWRVEQVGNRKPLPGEDLKWKFEQSKDGREAHFQFTSPKLRLTPSAHWTAKITSKNPELTLTLPKRVKRQGDTGDAGLRRRGDVYYAVFVIQTTKDGVVTDKQFAIGHNPPPKIDVGP